MISTPKGIMNPTPYHLQRMGLQNWNPMSLTMEVKGEMGFHVYVPIGKFSQIRNNFPEADFWITRRGSVQEVGKPTKKFNPENIGIKVDETGLQFIVPAYLYYAFEYMHMQGHWESRAKGTLKLRHITVADVKKVEMQIEVPEDFVFHFELVEDDD